MNWKLIGFVALLAVSRQATPAVSQTIEKPPHAEVDGNISWVYDYAEGQLLSQASGKPMFVVFRCER